MRRFIIAVLAASLLILSGCSDKAEHWAYNHEPDKEVLTLYDNGKAVFEDKDYTYSRDNGFINLTGQDGEISSHRYILEGDTMVFYKTDVYKRDGGSEKDGIYGKWYHDNGRNLFQFTKDGQFNEDNYFYGHFTLDENEGTIKLMYVDPLQDTLLYYDLDGDELTIDYPWRMVHVSEDTHEKGQVNVPATNGK